MFLNISAFSCMASNSLKSCGLMTNTNLIFTIEGEIFNLVFLAFFSAVLFRDSLNFYQVVSLATDLYVTYLWLPV